MHHRDEDGDLLSGHHRHDCSEFVDGTSKEVLLPPVVAVSLEVAHFTPSLRCYRTMSKPIFLLISI